MELNGAVSNPRLQHELSRLGTLHQDDSPGALPAAGLIAPHRARTHQRDSHLPPTTQGLHQDARIRAGSRIALVPICANWPRENPDEFRFCPACGAPLGSADATPAGLPRFFALEPLLHARAEGMW